MGRRSAYRGCWQITVDKMERLAQSAGSPYETDEREDFHVGSKIFVHRTAGGGL